MFLFTFIDVYIYQYMYEYGLYILCILLHSNICLWSYFVHPKCLNIEGTFNSTLGF